MIHFKDFEKSFFSLKDVDSLLPKLNEWIEKEKIQVVSIETIYSRGVETHSERGIRVWYKD